LGLRSLSIGVMSAEVAQSIQQGAKLFLIDPGASVKRRYSKRPETD
jgi:hypothetical protein